MDSYIGCAEVHRLPAIRCERGSQGPREQPSAAVASLVGQAAGNYLSGKSLVNPCNYDFGAAIGAGLGGSLAGNSVAPWAERVLYEPTSKIVSSVFEGVSVGLGELGGMWFTSLDNSPY